MSKHRATNKTAKDTPRDAAMAEPLVDQVVACYKTWILPYAKILLVIVVVAMVAAIVVQSSRTKRAEKQGQAFAALAKAENVDALISVVGNFPDTPAATRAQLDAGRKLYDQGKYEQALAKFSLARKSAGTELAVACDLGEAYALEASGKHDVAEKRFSDLAAKIPGDALVADCWLGAGRNAKAQGKLAEAEKFYQRAEDKLGDDPYAQRRVDVAMDALHAARYATRRKPPKAETGDGAAAAKDATTPPEKAAVPAGK